VYQAERKKWQDGKVKPRIAAPVAEAKKFGEVFMMWIELEEDRFVYSSYPRSSAAE
jgi:hypothetical protein